MSKRPGRTVWLLAGLMSVAACDCEDQIRKLVSDRGDRRIPASDKPKGSTPTETEPNDDPTAASTFPLGKELRDIEAVINTPDDVDWYAFTSGEEEAFELVVSPETALDISLHVEVEGSSALSYDEGRRGESERIGTLKIGAKPQRLVIRPQAGSSGTYRITLKRQLHASGLEGEPNDDTSVASAFTFPGEVQGSFDRPDDRDVYRLTGDPSKPFGLEIGAVRGGRHIARIFEDERLSTPQLTVQVVDTPVRIPNLVLDAEKPRWLVLTPLGAPPADQVYRIKATPHPALSERLEGEPNDVTPEPLAFAPPNNDGARVAIVSGYIHLADDKDQFGLTPPQLPPRGRPIPKERDEPDYLAAHRTKLSPQVPLSAHLQWTDDTSALGLRWAGADGTQVEFRQTSPELEVRACGLNLEGPAVIEVRAERLGRAPKPGVPQYTLELTETSAGDSFEAEPNGERGQADVLETARRGTFAIPDDIDIFAFAVSGEVDAVQKVRISAAARGVDIVMQVVDDGGGVVANVDNAQIGSGEFVDLELPPGLYYVELRWSGGDLCTPYDLEISR